MGVFFPAEIKSVGLCSPSVLRFVQEHVCVLEELIAWLTCTLQRNLLMVSLSGIGCVYYSSRLRLSVILLTFLWQRHPLGRLIVNVWLQIHQNVQFANVDYVFFFVINISFQEVAASVT